MLFDELNDENNDELWDDADEDGFIDAPADPDSIPLPNATATLIGHQAIEAQLLSMLDNNRFPHGLIFSGMEGVGKSVMAYRLARYLFAKGGTQDNTLDMFGGAPEKDTSLYIPPTDPVYPLVAGLSHADLRAIGRPFDEKTGRFKGSVPVEDIRKIAPFMRQTASHESGWRIVIIDDADTMTRASQNSLLKILEEPPEKSLLILVAHRAGALLPTIYSRCVHIPFAPLDNKIIGDALAGRCPAEQLSFITQMAEGSLGTAYRYIENDNLTTITDALALLNNSNAFSWTNIQHFADLFGTKGNEDTQRIFRETMLYISSALVRGKADIATQFPNWNTWPLEKKLQVYDDLRTHFDKCNIGNLDKRFMILGAYNVFQG